MSKPIIKLYSFPTSYQIREKLSASGIEFKPFEAVKVSVVIKPKTRRKMIVFIGVVFRVVRITFAEIILCL